MGILEDGWIYRQTDRQTYKCREVLRNGKMNRQTGRTMDKGTENRRRKWLTMLKKSSSSLIYYYINRQTDRKHTDTTPCEREARGLMSKGDFCLQLIYLQLA